MTEEHKNNISKGLLGHKHSEETKEKIRLKAMGRKVSLKTKEKMSKSWSYKKIITPSRNLKISESLKGEKHPQWKGGIAPLNVVIRNLPESKRWREAIFDRDGFICQVCFKSGGDLEAHHKKPFSIIMREFLEINSMFSPIEDKETLVRLALFYPDLWDFCNGETLCIECHKLKRLSHVDS